MTAQDQQSPEAYEDGKWYWVDHEGWSGQPSLIAPACYKADCDAWYSYVFSGISTRFLKVLGPCELQAARALPAPENVREGEPYDNPAFEDLARTMGVWGTAQAALCAQFFLAGRGAVPAGVEPVAFIQPLALAALQNPRYSLVQHQVTLRATKHETEGVGLFTAAQVLAMGRVPPGWQAVPVEATREMLAAGRNYTTLAAGAYRAMCAAAPRPPAAQEGA